MKKIFIRHMEYWYTLYKLEEYCNKNIDCVEMHITDESGENNIFWLEFLNINALKREIENGETLAESDEDIKFLIEKYNELKNKKSDYFIGGLWYPKFSPTIKQCDEALKLEKITDFKSPTYEPNYAVIYISEENSFEPIILINWVKKIWKELFKEETDFEIFDYLKYDEVLESYKIM